MACALKICGIVSREDLETCRVLGVDAIGINLWSGSPRGLSLDAAARVLGDAAPGGPLRVGVMVDPEPDELRAAHARLGLDLVQLHGAAPIERYAALGVPYVWVVRGTPALASLTIPKPAPAWVLLDALVAGFGGHGVRHDWTWAQAAVRALSPLPVWLAGGITPENAADAIATVHAAGLDVASGAESPAAARIGTKDRERIAALRSACSRALS